MRIASWAERKQVRSSEALEGIEAARGVAGNFLRQRRRRGRASVTPIFQAAAKGPQAPAVVIIGAGTAAHLRLSAPAERDRARVSSEHSCGGRMSVSAISFRTIN